MTAPGAGKPLRKTPLFTPYVVVWTMFGALSFGYLSILVMAPEWLDDLKPASFAANGQGAEGLHVAADVKGLRESVAQIQLDVAKIKTDVAVEAGRDKAFEMQLSAIEQRIGANAPPQIEAAAPAAPASTPEAVPTGETAATQNVAPATIAAAPAAAAESAPATAAAGSAQQPTLINADTQISNATLETGSVEPAAKAKTEVISFGPAVVKPAPKPLGVRISSGSTIESLRLSWSLLSDSHGATLKNMQPRYTTSGDASNPNFDLIAGPVKSRAEAAKMCKTLAAKNVPCKVGEFTGEAL